MSTEVGKLHYDLDIDSANLKKQLNDADHDVKNFGDSLSKHWERSVEASKKLLMGVTALAAGLVGFGVSSVKAFAESETAIAQTEAVLKSTGQAAGVTADEVTRLASALQRTTKYSDEEIRSGENLLLTFTKIGKDIFPEATKTMLDMSAALHQDLKTSAIQVGKALQDPILGVTALRKVGANFSKDQQEVIAKLVETGRAAEAQKFILKELNNEFGGSAEAAGKTFSGRLIILKNQFNDLQEAVGQTLIEALGPLIVKFGDWVNKVQEAGGLMAYLKKKFDENRETIIVLTAAIAGGLVPAFTALSLAAARTLLALAPFMALGAALAYLWENNKLLFFALTGAIIGFATALTIAAIPAIIAATTAAAGMAIAVIAATWPFVLIGAAVAALAYLVVTHWNTIKNAVIGAIQAIGNWLGAFPVWARVAVETVISWFGGMPGRILAVVGGLGRLLYNAGGDLIAGMIRGIVDKFAELAGKVKDAVGKAVGAVKSFLGIKSPSKVFMEIGRNVTAGFVKGITDSSGLAMDAMDHLANNVIAPTMTLAPAAGTAPGGNTTRYGDTVVNIGEIHNEQDEAYVLRRLDRNQQLESMGVSPTS